MREREHKGGHFGWYTLVIFLVLVLLSFSVLFFMEVQMRELKAQEFQTNERRVVKMERDFLNREFEMLIGDLFYLQQGFEEALLTGEDLDFVADQWLHFSAEKKIYDQIRYLNAEGDEVIRINVTETGSHRVIDENLQNKAGRYYFVNTLEQGERDVYISPLDLNVENGKVEEPYKPMIRLTVPVMNHQKQVEGVLVLNYLAERLLEHFRTLGENSVGEMILVNGRGYRLSSEDESQDWQFMFEDRKSLSFAKSYPSAWEQILTGEQQFFAGDRFFTTESVAFDKRSFPRISSDEILWDDDWRIISFVDRDVHSVQLFNQSKWMIARDVLGDHVAFFALLFLIALFTGATVSMNRKAYKKIKFHSQYDALTNTYNRRAGMELLKQRLASERRRDVAMSLCFIDINGLKEVNDVLGHRRGDELIVTVASQIKSIIREEDFLVRLGGDEFLLVLTGIPAEEAEEVWSRIVAVFETINRGENRPYLISVSHGIVDYEIGRKSELDYLLSEADQKMYEEKARMKRHLEVVRKA